MKRKMYTLATFIILLGLFCFVGCSVDKESQAALIEIANKSEHYPEEAKITETLTPAASIDNNDLPQKSEGISITPEPSQASPSPTKQEATPTPKESIKDIAADDYLSYKNDKQEWSLRREKNQMPSESYEKFDISKYGAYYRDKKVTQEDKVIYLTFDCGYENGFTPSILTTLKKHNAKAMFFVTKAFVDKNADLVKQMKEDGHMVGNHTKNHPSMPSLSIEKLKEEIIGLAELMEEKTGYVIDPFIRPPMGEYSERTLKLSQDLGYSTIFWSIVYYDYNVNEQPGKDFVVDHFKTYYHNGAIPLMHNTSQSNEEALDDVLTFLESIGYRFGTLDELQ